MFNSEVKARGDLHIVLTDAQGNIKSEVDLKNLVVTAGATLIAGLLRDKSPTLMTHMALGSGNTAAAAGQTALVAELGRGALASTAGSGTQVVYTASLGPGVGTGSVVEAGIFNAGAAGTMLCRTVFGVITKAAGDTMAITWNVTISG